MPNVPLDAFEQVLVLDGGSTDGSLEWCRAHGYDIILQTRPGLRLGLIEAWPHVRGDWVIFFPPDGNSDPSRILPLLDHVNTNGTDMCIVSRYLDWAKSADDTWLTRLANWGLTHLINRMFGGLYTDACGGFRAYRHWVPKHVDLLWPRPECFL